MEAGISPTRVDMVLLWYCSLLAAEGHQEPVNY